MLRQRSKSDPDAKSPRNSLRCLDLRRRRSRRARRRDAHRRGAATAVVIPRRRRRASQHRGIGACRHGNMEMRSWRGAKRRRRHAPCRGRVPFRALSARRQQAAAAGLGCHRRRLQDRRRALRAAAHQFPASPRRRLQGARTARPNATSPGRADAVGGGEIRDRGLCRRRRGRDDASV